MSLRYYNTAVTATPSDYSKEISMMCADVPGAPAAPTVVIANLDQIIIEWEPPSSDGGTPVLGYQVDMKEGAAGTYTQIYDGTEDPGARQIGVSEFNSVPLNAATYYFVVRAINWIGAGPDSAALDVTLSTQTDATNSEVSGPGIGTIEAYVSAVVSVVAKDSSGTDIGTGGDLFSLQISNQ